MSEMSLSNLVRYCWFRTDAMLEDDITDLLPELRPYQRRAAYWMVQRERGDPITLGDKEDNQFISPLSISIGFLDSASKMFFNPFRLVPFLFYHFELLAPP